MNGLLSVLDAAICEPLGWTIIHSLWQITGIALLYASAGYCLRGHSPRARYALGCASLAAMLCLPAVTLARLASPSSAPPTIFVDNTQNAIDRADQPAALRQDRVSRSEAPRAATATGPTVAETTDAPRPAAAATMPWSAHLAPALPWLSGCWMLGVLLFSLRPILGLYNVHRLRTRGLSPVTVEVRRIGQALSARLGIRGSVALFQSALVEVPTAAGYLRPVVLLPASALSGLTLEQLELILAHELAHIRRHDYLFNLLQTAVETVLFYHPAVWWLSAEVRNEREHCCDVVAVALGAQPRFYVGALLALEAHRSRAGLALTASGGSLLQRVQRLLAVQAPGARASGGHSWLSGLLPLSVLVGLLLLASARPLSSNTTEESPAAQPPLPIAEAPATESESPEQSDQPAKPADKATPAAASSSDTGGGSQLELNITTEDDWRGNLGIALSDSYRRPLKTWTNMQPGQISIDLPELESGLYYLEVTAPNFASRLVPLKVSQQQVEAPREPIALYRTRYLVLRYAVNMRGERELTGPQVQQGQVAISYGNTAEMRGDWMIVQNRQTLMFALHRSQSGNGFYKPKTDIAYDEIELAPEPDEFTPKSVEAEKGAILLTRIIGDGPRWQRYAKLHVEDITETPPAGMPVIDQQHPVKTFPRTPDARPSKPEADRTSGQLAIALVEEDNGQTPARLTLSDTLRNTLHVWNDVKPCESSLSLPWLQHDTYRLEATTAGYAPVRHEIKISASGPAPSDLRYEMFRLRYLVVRYVINTKGQRTLTGPNCQSGRVAILVGAIPDLGDWSVGQANGAPQAIVHRQVEFSGFAAAPEGSSFDELDVAPGPDDYHPQAFAFQKGMVLFNRVVGHKPENLRYAKLFVEDVTETKPANVRIIDARAK